MYKNSTMFRRIFIFISFLGPVFPSTETGMKILKVLRGLGLKEVNIDMTLDSLCFALMKLSPQNYPLVVNCGRHPDFRRNEQVNFITSSYEEVLNMHQRSQMNGFILTTIFVQIETTDYLPDSFGVNSTFGFFKLNLGKSYQALAFLG